MKKRWIEFHTTWQHSPMTYWVYRDVDGDSWLNAKAYEPAAPPPYRDKGYPMFHVELDGVPFRFASLLELQTCIQTFSQRVLPTTTQLVRKRGLKGLSNHVWLGRLPKKTHSLRYREKAIPYLKKALAEFQKQVSNQPLAVMPPSHSVGPSKSLGKRLTRHKPAIKMLAAATR